MAWDSILVEEATVGEAVAVFNSPAGAMQGIMTSPVPPHWTRCDTTKTNGKISKVEYFIGTTPTLFVTLDVYYTGDNYSVEVTYA